MQKTQMQKTQMQMTNAKGANANDKCKRQNGNDKWK